MNFWSRLKGGAEPAVPAVPLSTVLKTGTQKQHDEAEGHGLHAVLFGSQGVPAAREAYARLLGQHLLIQEAFEPLLRNAAPKWGAVVRDWHYHLADLRDDCSAMGVTEEMRRPLPATSRFIERIEKLSEGDGGASGLLGVFYVFEGSTNGGTIIAMRVKDLFGLEGEQGTRFINPHGTQVRPRWMEWKQAVDALPLSSEQREAAIAGAQEAFTLSHAVLGDVEKAMAAKIDGKPEVVVLPLKSAAAKA